MSVPQSSQPRKPPLHRPSHLDFHHCCRIRLEAPLRHHFHPTSTERFVRPLGARQNFQNPISPHHSILSRCQRLIGQSCSWGRSLTLDIPVLLTWWHLDTLRLFLGLASAGIDVRGLKLIQGESLRLLREHFLDK